MPRGPSPARVTAAPDLRPRGGPSKTSPCVRVPSRVATRSTHPAGRHSDSPQPAPAGPVIILAGPERWLQIDHTRQTLAQLRQQHGELDPVRYDGPTARLADVLDECRSLGLMQPHKLVIVDDAAAMLGAGKSDDDDDSDTAQASAEPGDAAAARQAMERYAAAPEPATTLILRARSWPLTRIAKAVTASGGSVIECDPLPPARAAAWCVARATSHHRASIARDAADLLVDRVGSDLSRLECELAKLALAAASATGQADAVIGTAHVQALVGESRQEALWEIQRGPLSGDPRTALHDLRHALSVSRHNPVAIGIAYTDLARKLDGAARALALGQPPGAIAARLKLWGPSRDAILDRAAAVRPADAAAILDAAIDLDARAKSGRGDPVRMLEGLTIRLTSLWRPRADQSRR
ncbi:MAG: DNA polymerase III subunit delta [Planctomyces sp.]|nr:DNA polymerase III subunit delta [Planctomyces sp.]